jgi:haloalkane dehalogenase
LCHAEAASGEGAEHRRRGNHRRALPGSVLRQLTDDEMTEYRRPFEERGEGRRPTLTWPRQIPIDGQPADVDAIVRDYSEWLAASTVPKLFIKGEPDRPASAADRYARSGCSGS